MYFIYCTIFEVRICNYFSVLVMQLGAMSLLFQVSWRFTTFPPEDIVCIIFCGVHKSLTLGMPMLKIMFEDSPHLAAMSLPLLIYHPTQIFLGGVLAPYMRSTIFRTNTRYMVQTLQRVILISVSNVY